MNNNESNTFYKNITTLEYASSYGLISSILKEYKELLFLHKKGLYNSEEYKKRVNNLSIAFEAEKEINKKFYQTRKNINLGRYLAEEKDINFECLALDKLISFTPEFNIFERMATKNISPEDMVEIYYNISKSDVDDQYPETIEESSYNDTYYNTGYYNSGYYIYDYSNKDYNYECYTLGFELRESLELGINNEMNKNFFYLTKEVIEKTKQKNLKDYFLDFIYKYSFLYYDIEEKLIFPNEYNNLFDINPRTKAEILGVSTRKYNSFLSKYLTPMIKDSIDFMMSISDEEFSSPNIYPKTHLNGIYLRSLLLLFSEEEYSNNEQYIKAYAKDKKSSDPELLNNYKAYEYFKNCIGQLGEDRELLKEEHSNEIPARKRTK